MTDRYYNVPLGGDLPINVTEGAADTSDFVAVRVTYDATGNSKEQAIKAINATVMYLLQEDWPTV